MTLYPIADDVLFAPGGKVVIRTYGVAPAVSGGAVSYRTWVTGVRDQPQGAGVADGKGPATYPSGRLIS